MYRLFSFGGVFAIGALGASVTHAGTVQLSGLFDIQQDIVVTAVGAPDYQDPNPAVDGFPFFEEYSRVLNEEANVFDQSQIPTSPIGADSLVTSFAQLGASFVFDSDLIPTGLDLLNANDPNGTLLGTSNEFSTARVFQGGDIVAEGAFGMSRVLAANDLQTGDGNVLDVIAIQVHNDPITEFNGGLTLFLGGGSTWFENLGAGHVDFSDLSGLEAVQVEYFEEVFSEQGDSLYIESISGGLTGDLGFRNFGAADGSGEGAPLLPDAVVSNDGSVTFDFDLTEVAANADEDGFVFIDPEVAVGYTYVLEGDGIITAIKAPTTGAVNDPDGYLVTVGTETVRLLPGQVLEIDPNDAVKTFELFDIDPNLSLDPASGTAFVLGVQFDSIGAGSFISQTATTGPDPLAAVPLPASMLMLGTALAGLGFAKRRRLKRA